MRHRKYTFKLGRSSAHRRAMLANMACSLIYESEIKTTLPKAKEARRFIEKLVTLGKKAYATDDKAKKVHYIRLAVAKIRDKAAVKYLFEEIAPQFEKRNGGYTRIIRIGKFRRGDAAELCLLQWVNEEITDEEKKEKTAEEHVVEDQAQNTVEPVSEAEEKDQSSDNTSSESEKSETEVETEEAKKSEDSGYH